jgi:hypothetical protein
LIPKPFYTQSSVMDEAAAAAAEGDVALADERGAALERVTDDYVSDAARVDRDMSILLNRSVSIINIA